MFKPRVPQSFPFMSLPPKLGITAFSSLSEIVKTPFRSLPRQGDSFSLQVKHLKKPP